MCYYDCCVKVEESNFGKESVCRDSVEFLCFHYHKGFMRKIVGGIKITQLGPFVLSQMNVKCNL